MNFRRRSRLASEVNTHSLNDIMFFLLLFFLITSSLVNPNMLKLNNPKSSNRVVPPKENVTVNIDKDRSFTVNMRKIETDRLPEAVNEELSKVKEPEPVIIINAEKSVPVDDIVKVMNVAKKTKARVVLQTQPE